MSLPRPVRTTEEIATYIRSLHPAVKKRIHNALDQMRMQPADGKPLQRELAGYRSFRVGKFRIIYRATAKEIETSVWNYYHAEDAPDKRDITQRLFDDVKRGHYEGYITKKSKFARPRRWWKMEKIKEPEAMAEIHRIRASMYAETEGMSIQELMRLFSKEAETFKRKHHLKLRTPAGKKTAVGA
jgi:mRNA-degrading endonuclease RelE of RelBE toxin-antitoxin system